MMRTARTLALVAFATLALTGCVRRARVVYVDVEQQAPAPVQTVEVQPQVVEVQPAPPPVAQSSIQIELQAGVVSMGVQCTHGAMESCNGLDDNCDGRIDEGCGWQSGAIQITSSWQTGADIDLYVTDPAGYVISYQDRQSPTGGILDHDARGACVSGGDTIENVYWSTPQPPRGQYYVELHYWGDCGVAGVTPVQVSIAVGGQVVGVYNATLTPGERIPVAMLPL